MIASSTYKLALKYPECENLHTEFHKDPFWDGPYLMCTSTIYVSDYCSLESYRLLQIVSIISSEGHRQGNSTNDQRPEESWWCCKNSSLINPDKMKLLLIGTCQMLQNVLADLDLHVVLLGKELHPVLSAKDPGVHGCYIKF